MEKTKEILKRVESDDFEKIDKLSTPKDSGGIYIIKEKEGSIFYIGSSSKRSLYKRVIEEHVEGKRKSVLRKKLVEKWENRKFNKNELRIKLNEKRKELNDYLTNGCLFIIEPIKDFDEILAVEHMLILCFRKVEHELLNDYKK